MTAPPGEGLPSALLGTGDFTGVLLRLSKVFGRCRRFFRGDRIIRNCRSVNSRPVPRGAKARRRETGMAASKGAVLLRVG